MKFDRNLVQCKVGYTEQFAFDTAYRFEADKHGRHVAEIHDQQARAFFLTNSSVFVSVPDEPEETTAYTPPAPANPLPPQSQRPAPLDPDGNAPDPAKAPEPELEQNPAPAAPGIGDQVADDADEANEPDVLEGEVLEADDIGVGSDGATQTPAETPEQTAEGESDTAPAITKESLEAMTKPDIIELAEKLDVVVVKRDTKAEIIEQLLAGLE